MNTRRDLSGWLVLAAVLALEWALFRAFAIREITGSYPVGVDQAVYLLKSYTIHERIWTGGFGAGVREAVGVLMPQGFLLQIEAALLHLLVGPSRLNALALNFVHFAALQCVMVAGLRTLHRGWSLPALGVGLLLCASLPFPRYGGMADFRLDFATACLYGMFVGSAVCSDGLRRRGWTILAGLLGVACVWTRHVTIAYVLGLLAAFAVFVAVRRGAPRRGAILARTLLLAATVVALTAPALWANRRTIYQYYVVGHVTGAEKGIRAREFGVKTTVDAFLFYPRSVARDHAGPAFLWGAGAVGVALALASAAWLRRSRVPAAAPDVPFDVTAGLTFLGLSIVVPLAILTLDESKSPIVGGVVVPALAWFVAVAAWSVLRRSLAGLWMLKALGALAGIVGIWWYGSGMVTPTVTAQDRADARTMIDIYDSLAQYAQAAHWRRLQIANTSWQESTWPPVLPVLFYERHHWLPEYRTAAGLSIFEPEPKAFLDGVRGSDVVFLRDAGDGSPAYPFHAAMQRLHPEVRALCDRDFFLLRQVSVFGAGLRVYVRPSAAIEGVSGDWITASGVRLRANGDVLAQRPRIRFSGAWKREWLRGRTPRACGTLEVGSREPIPVPARVSVDGDLYTVEVDVPAEAVRRAPDAAVHLVFDAFFTPGEVDPRRLVVRAPERVDLLRREEGDVPASSCPFDPEHPVDVALAPRP